MKKKEIDGRVYDLYDDYCHGRIERRAFLSRAAALTVAGGSALASDQSGRNASTRAPPGICALNKLLCQKVA